MCSMKESSIGSNDLPLFTRNTDTIWFDVILVVYRRIYLVQINPKNTVILIDKIWINH